MTRIDDHRADRVEAAAARLSRRLLPRQRKTQEQRRAEQRRRVSKAPGMSFRDEGEQWSNPCVSNGGDRPPPGRYQRT